MFEIIMMFAFLYAATCQLFPRTKRGDNPDLLRKKPPGEKLVNGLRDQTRSKTYVVKKPVKCSNRKPAQHLQYDRPWQGSKKAGEIKLNRMNMIV